MVGNGNGKELIFEIFVLFRLGFFAFSLFRVSVRQTSTPDLPPLIPSHRSQLSAAVSVVVGLPIHLVRHSVYFFPQGAKELAGFSSS